jgi:propionyl-CoA carboxylase alpha chain
VTAVSVKAGERVSRGQVLLTLEAMKMEHAVAAPSDGTVTELPVQPGQQVEPGTVLAVVSKLTGE